ncbi:GSCOCG00011142001-RA-CDS, partial [Cotesia congregata]
REQFREKRAAEIQHRFKNTELSRLIIHWDGNHLPDITGRNFVERLPIIISAEKETKILSIPKLENFTGRLCCDTIASNTGQFNGAAVLIEQLLERDLLLLPCRHHIFEVILKAVFDCQISNVSGPNVSLFIRFRKEWDALD